VALRPLEVHAQQHLRPVGGLGAARARADRQDGVLGVVVAGEQEEGPLALELRAQGVSLSLEVRERLGVGRIGEEVQQLLEVGGALLESPPQGDLVAQALGLAGDLLRRTLVVPEAGLDGSRVELCDALFLGG
jgi:hypothetical protein